MHKLVRFGVAMEAPLLHQFDHLIKISGYRNRSEALRDLVRERLVRQEWDQMAGDQLGTLTLIYNHHTPNLSERINTIQHRHRPLVISTMHIHLENDFCLEVMAVRGDSVEIRKFSDYLTSLKGVIHGQLVMTATGSTFHQHPDPAGIPLKQKGI